MATVRVPRTLVAMLREVAPLLRDPALLVWSLFVLLIPFYVFSSGLPQPGDLLVIPLVVIALRPWTGRLARTARRPISALIAFTAWVIVVDWGWALILGNFGRFGPNTFLLFPVYYVYDNTLVFLIVCVLYQRYGALFVWLTHKEYWLLGAGEGGTARFAETTIIGAIEIHSSAGTIFFSYGIVGVALMLVFLFRVAEGARLGTIALLTPALSYTVAHQGLRSTSVWILFGMFVCLKHLQRAGAAPSTAPLPAQGASPA